MERSEMGDMHNHLCWYCWEVKRCTLSGCKDAPSDYKCDTCGEERPQQPPIATSRASRIILGFRQIGKNGNKTP
jgi:hypothetical protein